MKVTNCCVWQEVEAKEAVPWETGKVHNQLTIDLAFLQAYMVERYCITVPPRPDIIWGNSIPQKI